MKSILALILTLSALPVANATGPASSRGAAGCCACCDAACCNDDTCKGCCCDSTCCQTSCCDK